MGRTRHAAKSVNRPIALTVWAWEMSVFRPIPSGAGSKLGAPKIQGNEAVDGKSAPALYFGSTKMNNNFTVVDEGRKRKAGQEGGHTVRKGRRRIHPRCDQRAEP